MSFVSYAQNFEDVMLWRALKHVDRGFYIDVGANDPTLYSVTRAFYEKGWHGINVEPVTKFFERLQAERPRDTNLQIGAGEVEGSFPFFDIPDTGLATADPVVAQAHRDAGREVCCIEIPVLPLSEICRQNVTGEIHFLKIDVEGAEKNVLLGMDFKKWRPWLVLVEATRPMSQETVHQDWEFLLTEAAYEFVYFDGLNRYYIAGEHPELKPAFATPPNVFDSFVLNGDQESKIRIAEAEATAWRAQQRASEATERALSAENSARIASEQALTASAQADSANQQREAMAKQLATVLDSTSWRITRPLRAMVRALRGR